MLRLQTLLTARHLLVAAALILSAPGPALAQLSLPGATAPAPVGSVVTPSAKPKPKPRAPVTPLVPRVVSLAGKTLHLNGGKTFMAFEAQGADAVALSQLFLSGTKISDSREACELNVQGMPLPLTPVGKVEGLLRFSLPVPACPITFDVLDGAILVPPGPACAFKAADCNADPVGLWGPPPGDIGVDQVKTIEKERNAAERRVRAAYHGLVASTKDRAVIRQFASEQAGFSSHREESCRDYIGEARHGYCASRLTAARASALETQLVGAQAQKELRKAGAK